MTILALALATVHGSGASEPIRVTVSVPVVLQVDGPTQVRISPGSTARVRVRIAANCRWQLALRVHNAYVYPAAGPFVGGPGGWNDAQHTFEVPVRCDPDSPGPQSVDIEYVLITG